MPGTHRARGFVTAFLLLTLGGTLGGTLGACAPQSGQASGQSDSPSTPPLAASTATATSAPTTPVPPTTTNAPTSTAAPSAPSDSPTAPGAATAGPYAFPLLAPGATLPSEASCAAQVQRSSRELRPANQTANSSVPTGAQIAALSPWDASIGLDPKADQLRRQITGKYTGTTDEILQWVACKWGVPVDVVRAEAVIESNWYQSQQGDYSSMQSDCPPGTWTGSSCNQSYGILQIKYKYNVSAWPMSRDDTAFSAEYSYGMIRACYEGWTTYLSGMTPQPGYPTYHAGDLWGCLGRWYSGAWYDQDAIGYIARVKAMYDQKPWLSAGF